ncbi:Cytochrome P450 [Mycena kentingensis (nom. inval.)]|nr:Cytochrome P450 [Mycena kentingensis (nom. inval.)]
MAYLYPAVSLLAALALYRLIKRLRAIRLNGPSSPSFIFGNTKEIAEASNLAALYDEWAQMYGPVYRIRGPFGTDRLVVCDPKALAHHLALDSWKYSHPPLALLQIGMLTGPGNLLSTFGEAHTRLRKILNPLFAPAALRRYAPLMYDSVYKIFATWEAELQASPNGEIMPDVSEWINNLSFDIIGLAAFSTDFKSLDGEKSPVAMALSAVGHAKPSPIASKIFLLSQAVPILFKLPLPRSKLVGDLSSAMDDVVDALIRAAESGKLEKEQLGSALGVLLSNKELAPAEMRIHAKSILLSGFATTASGIKARWALVELSMQPKRQDRLRAELLAKFPTTDPSYDDLSSTALPYLDAVVREALRLHPILAESSRVALEDDILPLSAPIRTTSGALIDRLPIPKGTGITISMYWANSAESIWGADGGEFKPERWLDGNAIPAAAQEYPGYHHTMIFSEGPRTCLGKGFALLETKARRSRLGVAITSADRVFFVQIVLSLLIRKFVFIPRDGMDTKYDRAMYIGPHPKVAGEPGGRLPIRVRRVEAE